MGSKTNMMSYIFNEQPTKGLRESDISMDITKKRDYDQNLRHGVYLSI